MVHSQLIRADGTIEAEMGYRFMAVSRLVDLELMETQKKETELAEAAEQAA
jgi:hypothetical protein